MHCPFPQNAGWSSLVARQAHNLKVAGSNPAPATTLKFLTQRELRSSNDTVEAAIEWQENALKCTKMTAFGPESGPERRSIPILF